MKLAKNIKKDFQVKTFLYDVMENTTQRDIVLQR